MGRFPTAGRVDFQFYTAQKKVSLTTGKNEFRPADILLVEDKEDEIALTLRIPEDSKLPIETYVVSDGMSTIAFYP